MGPLSKSGVKSVLAQAYPIRPQQPLRLKDRQSHLRYNSLHCREVPLPRKQRNGRETDMTLAPCAWPDQIPPLKIVVGPRSLARVGFKHV